MNKERTCKDCRYFEFYNSSNNKSVMRYIIINTAMDVIERTCWRFEPKEKHCVTNSEQKSSSEPKTQENSTQDTSCYKCIDYIKKDGKHFCKCYADYLEDVSAKNNCFTKKIRCYSFCKKCRYLKEDIDDYLFCTQYRTNIDYEVEDTNNEECPLFEAENKQPEEDRSQACIGNKYIKELQVASNLLLYAHQLLSLQEYYEKLKNMGSEIPDTKIDADAACGVHFYFHVDPIDTYEFLKKQLIKQMTLLRTKIMMEIKAK